MVDQLPLKESTDLLHIVTPTRSRKMSCSEPQSTLHTPRRLRAPSISETMMCDISTNGDPTAEKLSLRVRATADEDTQRPSEGDEDVLGYKDQEPQVARTSMRLDDLPLEIQGLILDYLFGDMHSVTSSSTSLDPGIKRITSSMRHPRRKALADVALVSPTWRELVQERIYRHIKIKANRAGLKDATDWFNEHWHLCKHVRHMEYWVPVWADRPPKHRQVRPLQLTNMAHLAPVHNYGVGIPSNSMQNANINSLVADNFIDPRQNGPFPFNTGVGSATLSEIFRHATAFFFEAQIFTLEGGHCKNSHMIGHFPTVLFPDSDRRLASLPNVRTFAMRGAWNVMREYSHWYNIEKSLPGVQEWHCAYARPRPEAYSTIISILSSFPSQIRHVNISLDGFYSRDGPDESESVSQTGPQSQHHMCERLGKIAPMLESLSFTGRICECFFRKAASVARGHTERSRLRTVDIAVKACCRLLLTQKNTEDLTSEDTTIDPSEDTFSDSASIPVLASSHPSTAPSSSTTQILVPSSNDSLSGITNMTFINSFERLVLSAVRSLHPSSMPSLSTVRIRFIDLDSACTLLNPYFTFKESDGGRCRGIWNDEILDALWTSRPGCVGWDELSEGIEKSDAGLKLSAGMTAAILGTETGGVNIRVRPGAIRGGAYRMIAEPRALT